MWSSFDDISISLPWLAFSARRFHRKNAPQNTNAAPTAAPTLAPIAVKFVVDVVSGLGAMVCVDVGSAGVVDIAIGKGADIAADVVDT